MIYRLCIGIVALPVQISNLFLHDLGSLVNLNLTP